jgi:hypothetical protein
VADARRRSGDETSAYLAADDELAIVLGVVLGDLLELEVQRGGGLLEGEVVELDLLDIDVGLVRDGDLAGLLERDLDAADDGDVDEEDDADEVGDDAPGLDVPVGALDVIEDEGDRDLDGLLARTEVLNRKLRRIRGERAVEGSREGRRGLTPTGLLGAEDVDVGVDLGLEHGADRSGIQQAVMVRHRRSGSHRRRQRVRARVSKTRRGNRDRGYRPR